MTEKKSLRANGFNIQAILAFDAAVLLGVLASESEGNSLQVGLYFLAVAIPTLVTAIAISHLEPATETAINAFTLLVCVGYAASAGWLAALLFGYGLYIGFLFLLVIQLCCFIFNRVTKSVKNAS